MNKFVIELVERYPQLKDAALQVECAINMLIECYENGGKLLLCGNGGFCG